MSDPAGSLPCMAIDYSAPGPLTDLSRVDPAILDQVPHDPVAICGLAHALIVHPFETKPLDLPEERFADNQLRPADAIVGALLRLYPEPLHVPREPHDRAVGTCRHFTVLTTALLRHRGFEARARCGFATYFQEGKGVDHWVVELKQGKGWTRFDAQIVKADLTPEQFLSGGEAWIAHREGRIDASLFGVGGTENWGPGEIRGNTVKDLAALNKVEMLPWDEWGRMEASFKDETDAHYDDLMDVIAKTCAEDDPAKVASLYHSEDFEVPHSLI